LANHQAKRSIVTLTQTCTNKETGDACDIVVGLDSWLTQDEIAGVAEKTAFRTAYAQKIGLDETAGMFLPQMQTLLAPYADALRQANAKASVLKGYPLKTSISISMGGERCAASKAQPQVSGGNVVADASGAAAGAAADSAAGAAGSAAGQAVTHSAGTGVTGMIAGSAAGAFGSKLIGGMFHKKQPPSSPPTASASAAQGAATSVRLAELTIETTAITSNPIPSDEFNVPVGWKLYQPKPKPEHDVQCPKVQ
jgi:hypothetical protein